MNQIEIQYGNIYLVDFSPSIGHEFQKCRPAVVIQSNKKNQAHYLITIMPLTSNLDNFIKNEDILVNKSQQNRLYADSILKTQSIISFDRQRFIKYIGVMEQEILEKVKVYVKRHFDL